MLLLCVVNLNDGHTAGLQKVSLSNTPAVANISKSAHVHCIVVVAAKSNICFRKKRKAEPEPSTRMTPQWPRPRPDLLLLRRFNGAAQTAMINQRP